MRIRRHIFIASIVLALLALLTTFPFGTSNAGNFSFVVFGDSRLPGNMNFTKGQIGADGAIEKYLRANSNNTIGADDCQLRFSPYGKLIGLKVPKSSAPYRDISLNCRGWPERIMDSSQSPPLILLYDGQKWVYEKVVDQVKALGNEGFVLHTGDISYNGYYGTRPCTSVYWQDFKERLLDKLPEGSPKGLFGRFFSAIGNHETWLDPENNGLLNTVPYLEKLKVSACRHTYLFDYNDSRFIFLDTGGDPPAADWSPDSKPCFSEQMTQLREWLQDARENNIEHVFITLHKPPFCSAGHGHLPEKHNPHPYLVPFAEDESRPLDITVFSGHVHSTEMYYQDKIRYLVIGGGGAEQVYCVNTCCISDPDDPYCKGELYWDGANRRMEYNYLTVTVGDRNIALELNRWRPDSATPYQTCIIDQAMNITRCR